MNSAASFLLPQSLLERCRARAAQYDRENTFFHEDFAELRDAGLLLIAVPTELGGHGRSLAQVCHEMRRLARFAPATALAMVMHIYWTGTAADLWRSGDKSLEWLLKEVVAGEVFASGHSESGNDVPVFLSTTQAVRVEGGYRITGQKTFGSLTPVWTRMGFNAMDVSDPQAPKIVHGFLRRDSEGLSIRESWDTLGMRATRSEDTKLDQVFVADHYVARVLPAGAGGVDQFLLTEFAWAPMEIANVYFGIAQRALELTLASVKEKKSIALSSSMAHHPAVQHGIATMTMEIEAIGPHLDRIADEWCAGINHGPMWPAKIAAAKYRAVQGTFQVVNQGLELTGGFGIFKRNEIERLFRDARLGSFHPPSSALTHEMIGKTMLGIHPDAQPRWG